MYFCANEVNVKSIQKILFPLVLLVIGISGIQAQNDVTTQSQLWLRYNPRITIYRDVRIKADLDQRVYLPNFRQHQYVGRAQLEYDITNNWKVSGGLSYFQTALPQDFNVDVVSYGQEIRPELETNFRLSASSIMSFQQRFRTDLRFFENDNAFSYRNTRFRYMATGSYPLFDNWSISIWDEIHLNGLPAFEINFFDQNRIGTNVTWSPDGPFAFDLMYFNIFQRRMEPNTYFSQHIFRFTLIHTIDAFDQSSRCGGVAKASN